MSYVSHADLGGQPGQGVVVPEAEGELFHAAWEPKALALSLAMGATGSWNIDIGRSARETLPNYATLSYYEIWTLALQKLLEERHLVDADEIGAGHKLREGPAVTRVLLAGNVPTALASGSASSRSIDAAAQFAVGQRVKAHSGHVDHHTRLPAYVSGHIGVVERNHGAHVFADAHAQGLGEQPQYLYTVAFDGTELWGDDSAGLTVSVDAWESYLEPV